MHNVPLNDNCILNQIIQQHTTVKSHLDGMAIATEVQPSCNNSFMTKKHAGDEETQTAKEQEHENLQDKTDVEVKEQLPHTS